jgi:predicted CxxxxCH...CXXCH cytochrome family protein
MRSNGHDRLVGKDWIRKYPCEYCHAATVDDGGNIIDPTRHGNNVKDVLMSSQWAIVGRGAPLYNAETKVCSNVYCHSDGTTDPEQVRPFGWTENGTHCNTCHGHPRESCNSTGCHDGRIDANGRDWPIKTGWPSGEEWKEAMPMFPNEGAGTARANSHPRHLQTNFPCDKCHYATIKNGTCTVCHTAGIPPGSMSEVAHIDPAFHVNKEKDVVFKEGGTFNKTTKACSNTACHTGGTDPQWGGSINTSIICLNCHGTTLADIDDFEAFNGTQAKISLNDWATTGHGRPSSAGPYPVSGNPAANFPGNPCWYCHDNTILHRDVNNPFRLRLHQQFGKRFEKECVYCHMQGIDSECLGCHNSPESLAPQLADITSPPFSQDHTGFTGGCVASCHATDATRHKTGSEDLWTAEEKNDIKNQYMMMGVCLKCHDDDSDGKCTVCHTGPQYVLGFDPGTGFITAQSKATSVHFGYKHYAEYVSNGVWKGGKFCWDCHDPHGDQNIYMIHKEVATTTDGTFGKPLTRAEVEFTNNIDGSYYAKYSSPPYNGICNVCHTSGSQHYRADGGDGHNIGRKCTNCHEHRFTDSHASVQACYDCHQNKPVPRHSGFGLPRDCTKCHAGTIGMRMDVMGQLKSNSHHIQGVTATNKHCYACHFESTAEGLIDITRHQGYDYKTHNSVKNAEVDLVIWGAGTRPANDQYVEGVTAVKFLASNMGTANERAEVSKISAVCLSCHSDQNNDTQPFGDCKTPRQYAWDKQSIAARYSQTGTTTWGKYTSTAGAAPKNLVKAYSAHGNAVNNQGGWSATTGYDGALTDTRNGSANVQCFDCHSSHGSKVNGVTSSYVTFNGTNNGANLKETQAGKGGYSMSYKASSNPNSGSINPYGAGAGQCFDCHETANKGTTPWGYNSTFGATAPIMGYKDTSKFGQGDKGSTTRYSFRDSKKTIMGGHLKASSDLAKDSGTATAGSTTTLTTAKTWTTNQWKDYFVSMQTGSNNGQMRKIISNTTNTLTVEEFSTAVVEGDNFKIVPYATAITGGLCTPCHDPHGVSPALGASNQAYAVPLLKGTWMTSPYKEDAPPPDPTLCASGPNANAWGYGYYQASGKSYGAHANGCYPNPQSNHYIDKNTFGGANTRVTEDDQKFAGLCLTCHQKSTLTDGTNKNTNWKSKDRIHESVKGWGANTEHSFTCSKCHQVHNSGLPRLMQTDCLDHKHRGNKASGGVPWGSINQYSGARTHYGATSSYGPPEYRGYPVANIYSNSASYPYETSCHFNAPSNSGTWPNRDLWNSVTPW